MVEYDDDLNIIRVVAPVRPPDGDYMLVDGNFVPLKLKPGERPSYPIYRFETRKAVDIHGNDWMVA